MHVTQIDRQRDGKQERRGIAGMSQKVVKYTATGVTGGVLFVLTRPPASSNGATEYNFNSHLKQIRWQMRPMGSQAGGLTVRHPCVLIRGASLL